MKEFNENPFAFDTEVKPFNNGTEAMIWHERNCDKCIKYSECKLALNIDEGFVLSYIELWAAKEIGCKYDPLYQTCELSSQCREFRTGNEPF